MVIERQLHLSLSQRTEVSGTIRQFVGRGSQQRIFKLPLRASFVYATDVFVVRVRNAGRCRIQSLWTAEEVRSSNGRTGANRTLMSIDPTI